MWQGLIKEMVCSELKKLALLAGGARRDAGDRSVVNIVTLGWRKLEVRRYSLAVYVESISIGLMHRVKVLAILLRGNSWLEDQMSSRSRCVTGRSRWVGDTNDDLAVCGWLCICH